MKLPYISKDPGELKITLDTGEVFYAHDLQESYSFVERREVIKNTATYFKDAYPTSTGIYMPPILHAYYELLWYLFRDYINAYNFRWVNPFCSNKKSKKHLYVLRNSNGFIKVGIASNIQCRIVDLAFEFDGTWEVLKVYYNQGHKEKESHGKLMEYIHPVVKKNTNKFSTECFSDCPEVMEICMNL